MRGAAAAALALLLAAPAAAAPRLPEPPGCRVAPIGEELIVNGIPMDIRKLRCRSSAGEVLEFYRNYWPRGSEDKPGYVETDELPPWQMITRVERGHLMTVQITQETRELAVGYLAMSEIPQDPERLPELGEGFPAMRGTQVYNDIRSKDPGKHGRTLQFSNKHGLRSNVIFYRNYYRDRGWTAQMDRAMGRRMHTFSFNKSGESVNLVVIQGEGATAVTAQVIEEGWW